MTFWQRVEKALFENKLSEADLSRKLNIAQSSVNGWKTKGSLPRIDIACNTAKILHTTVEYLMNGKQPETSISKDSFIIPIINKKPKEDSESSNSYLELPSFFKQFDNNLTGIYVHGDSMEPTIANGSLALVVPAQWDKTEGLYGIKLNGTNYVKRIQVASRKIVIISDNPRYKEIEDSIYSDSFEIIGKVVGILNYNKEGM